MCFAILLHKLPTVSFQAIVAWSTSRTAMDDVEPLGAPLPDAVHGQSVPSSSSHPSTPASELALPPPADDVWPADPPDTHPFDHQVRAAAGDIVAADPTRHLGIITASPPFVSPILPTVGNSGAADPSQNHATVTASPAAAASQPPDTSRPVSPSDAKPDIPMIREGPRRCTCTARGKNLVVGIDGNADEFAPKVCFARLLKLIPAD